MMNCRETSLTDKTEIGFLVYSDGRTIIYISKDIQFHLENQIEFALRVDRGELRNGLWDYLSSNSSAYVTDNVDLFMKLLSEISTGERVAIKVGAESGNILLRGAYHTTVDFLARTQDLLPRNIIP